MFEPELCSDQVVDTSSKACIVIREVADADLEVEKRG